MLYGKQALRGTAVHAYRDEARAGNKHYDAGLKHEGHIQSNRILLKAQPQQGKTGAPSPYATPNGSPVHAAFLQLMTVGYG